MPRSLPPVLLAVDPGKDGCGVAVFYPERACPLECAAYVPRPDYPGQRTPAALTWGMVHAVVTWAADRVDITRPPDGAVVLVESMKVYAGAKGHADPADLLHLEGVGQGVACVFAAMGWTPESALAREWNGQVPRDVRIGRTRAWLEGLEPCGPGPGRVLVPRPASLVHNAWSAVGIGRWRITGAK